MAELTGKVTDIAINWHKASFKLDPDGQPPTRIVLFDDDPNTHTIAQVQLATRSWMLALLQTAFTTGRPVNVKFDAANTVEQIDLQQPPLKINPDVVGKTPIKVPVG